MRRTLVAVVLAASLASGLRPANAAAPDTARVRLGSGPDAAEAFVAFPPGASAPSVIVVHEWWGLNPQIRDFARRLSRQGYCVIVPDLFGGRVAGDPETAHELSRAVDEERAMVVLGRAAQWLREQPRTAKSRIGVIGFCMGGSLAQSYAMGGDATAAVVVFYGTPETDPSRLARLQGRLQGHFGAADSGIGTERVESFKAALTRAGKTHEIHVYAGAGHAFMNEERPSFNADAARLAWARMLAFLQKHLKG